jgi:hypothetical protein
MAIYLLKKVVGSFKHCLASLSTAFSLRADIGQGAYNVGAVAFDMIITEACGATWKRAAGGEIDARPAISCSGRMGKQEGASANLKAEPNVVAGDGV